ncbi:MAG: hypothetical protein K1Y36_29215 [Blastocatellia bacterium]|nr:hypothetical protein [Blastocatellia bacterium]
MLHLLREIRAGWLSYKQIRQETKDSLVRKIEARVPRKVILTLVCLFLAIDLALVVALANRSGEISWTVSDAYQTWTKSRQYAGAAERILTEIRKGQPPFEHTGLGDLYVDPNKKLACTVDDGFRLRLEDAGLQQGGKHLEVLVSTTAIAGSLMGCSVGIMEGREVVGTATGVYFTKESGTKQRSR